MAQKFANAIIACSAKELSPAAIQGHFLKYKEDPHEAVNRASDLIKDC